VHQLLNKNVDSIKIHGTTVKKKYKLEFIFNYSCFIPALKSPQYYVRVSIYSNDVLPYVSNIL